MTLSDVFLCKYSTALLWGSFRVGCDYVSAKMLRFFFFFFEELVSVEQEVQCGKIFEEDCNYRRSLETVLMCLNKRQVNYKGCKLFDRGNSNVRVRIYLPLSEGAKLFVFIGGNVAK